ncbi:MAG: hypothetical protein WBW81_15905 [Methylocella sp.]
MDVRAAGPFIGTYVHAVAWDSGGCRLCGHGETTAKVAHAWLLAERSAAAVS